MQDLKLHENIQAYFDMLYTSLGNDIQQSMFGYSNEIYGELYYYSAVKLLRYLKITEKDRFLDLGSGLGKLVFQVFLTTNAASVVGVEINNQRSNIACKIKEQIMQTLPGMFADNRKLDFVCDDFLKHHFDNISIVYVCATVFSFDLLNAIGEKINNMPSVQQLISFRKLPNISNFRLIKKLFLHGTWDKSACYIYARAT